MTAIIAFVIAGAATWTLRASFILAGPRWQLGPGLRRSLVFVRPAVIGALVASAILGGGGAESALLPAEQLVALAIAGAVAALTRSLPSTFAAGAVSLLAISLIASI